jgi:hypothetical protein
MTTDAVTPLRHRMIEDMNARKLCAGTQRGHIHSCKRFAAFLNRSPAPRGERNGNYRHGLRTIETTAQRRQSAAVRRKLRQLLGALV